MAKSGMSESKESKENDCNNGGTETSSSSEQSENETSVDKPVSKSTKRVSTPVSILIESLIKNLCAIYQPDSEKVSILYNLICSQLYRMEFIDESYKMVEFEAMRSQYQKAFHNLLLKESQSSSDTVTLRPVWPSSDWKNSHYYREFDEIEYIAGGGFGKVYRVKHKLDGTEYAVKKITIRSEGIQSVRNYLSEVKTFACLNHSNIVQYKAAWLELGSPGTSKHAISDGCDTRESTISVVKQNNETNYIFHEDMVHSFSDHEEDTTSDFEVNFEHNSVCSFSNHSKKSKRKKRSSISEGGMAICKFGAKDINKMKAQQKGHGNWATLYIQMALCQFTLKQWLERRNDSEWNMESNSRALMPVKSQIVRNETILEVLKQLVQGLGYIHSKKIVHHDIKPSNIFIQYENGHFLVQLGDFGLACPLQNARHSLAFGTKLYAAPEQLAGKCDPKSDMYSLGIVLFELVENFHTDMERVKHINELRKGNLPPHLQIQHPQLAPIISQLMVPTPEDRPEARDLLRTLISTSEAYIQELETRLIEKDEEILRLKKLLKCADNKSI